MGQLQRAKICKHYLNINGHIHVGMVETKIKHNLKGLNTSGGLMVLIKISQKWMCK